MLSSRQSFVNLNLGLDRSIVKIELHSEIDGEICLKDGKEQVLINEEVKAKKLNPILPSILFEFCRNELSECKSVRVKTVISQGVVGLKVCFDIVADVDDLTSQKCSEFQEKLKRFMEYLYSQSQLDDTNQVDCIDSKIEQAIKSDVALIKSQYGGKDLIAPADVTVNNVAIYHAKGKIQSTPLALEELPGMTKARYDGRQFSKRIAFFLVENGRELRCYYDQDAFDWRLSQLDNNPDSILDVRYKKLKEGSKESCYLVDFSVAKEIEPPLFNSSTLQSDADSNNMIRS